jgi:ketosteroid isomerase-like protein
MGTARDGQDAAKVEEVLRAEWAWTEAHRRLDVATIERLMADDYVIVRPDGSVDGKAAALASYQPETRHWDFAQSDELDVRVFGDTAVVVGRWRGRGVNNGEPFDYAARFISLYVKRDGCWQIVTDQSTPIKPG